MRRERFAGIADRQFDVLVIGGGMAGAGITRDAALRGLSVALVEKHDFAFGTTSRSSKLIHGGLRYLELFDFGLVAESLRERERLRRMAPHLIRPLPFIIPVYRGAKRGMIQIRIGLALYDLLTPGRRVGRYGGISRERALTLEPGLDGTGLKGAGFYFDDLLLNPERLCLENVFSARRHGARVYNYARVEEFLRDGSRLVGARVRDVLTGEVVRVRAAVLVNATGPWIDQLRALAGLDGGQRIVRTTKGVHMLLPRLTSHAVYVQARDDRMFFVIPWRTFSLVGTTDTDFAGDLDRLYATAEEVEYLLSETRRVFPRARIGAADIVYTYAGVRPLTYEEGERSWQVSRAHKVIVEGEGGNFLSITGVKLTCYRQQAEEAVDRIRVLLGRGEPVRTHRLGLDGLDTEVTVLEARIPVAAAAEAGRYGVEPALLETLVETYGHRSRAVLDRTVGRPDLKARLCPSNPDIAAQLLHAVEEEAAVRLTDVLLRRTGIGTSPCLGRDCAEAIAARMAVLCGWDRARQERELAAYWEEVALGQRFREAGA
ncbi:MAG: glycerol-3-phosphate dehydrogenase/oxidase, partial [candidate division NC10 bacterium]|nr:glycerol-3-phosphate dehydrogenase/oxidase [candidate division NC10 bacterium]